MFSLEEVSGFKKAYDSLEKRMEKIGKGRCHTIVVFAARLKELMAEIDSTREKEKGLWNPALTTRIRIAKKGFSLSKELNAFEMDVAAEFEKGNLTEDAGKKFILSARLIKENKMEEAKKEFRYFDDITELHRRFGMAEEEMKEKDRLLRREMLRVQKTLTDIASLEKESVDLEKARRYEELLGEIEKLKDARRGFIHSLLSSPVVELLRNAEKNSLKDFLPSFPGQEELDGLAAFFSEYPVFGRCDAGQLCAYFGYSEKKLSHVCPETTRFRKVVAGRRDFFESIISLEKTGFLAVDINDERIMGFYARNVKGAGEIVGRIGHLKNDMDACRGEYEKRREVDGRRKELSAYSKTALEAELGETERLLGLLHSKRPEAGGEGEGGLLSIIGRLFKK